MRQGILRILSVLYLGSSAAGLVVGCTHGERKLDGKLWHGSSEHDGIWRKQDDQAIRCSDPKIDQFTALLTTDLVAHDKACKEWY